METNQKIIAIIQARLGSSRLPGKVLMDIEGKTMLERVVERTRRAKLVQEVLVTMPLSSLDDRLAEFCKEQGIAFERGREEDLLDQYLQAANKHNAQIIVRITADCPLIDSEVIDRAIQMFTESDVDYLSTGRLVTTFPDGLDTEVFTISSLKKAWNEARLPSEREHVTPYIWNHPELFRIITMKNDRDLSSLRWTVDEMRDIEFVRSVYSVLKDEPFGLVDVLRLLDQKPELKDMNADITRNSGYFKSLHDDNNLVKPQTQRSE